MCPAHFQDQGHMTFTVHFLFISCSISNFTFHAHLQDTQVMTFNSCTFPVISEISCVGYVSIVKDM